MLEGKATSACPLLYPQCQAMPTYTKSLIFAESEEDRCTKFGWANLKNSETYKSFFYKIPNIQTATFQRSHTNNCIYLLAQFSRSVMSTSLRPHEPQHTRPPCPSPTPGVYSNSCPLSQWCHPTISSSVVPFSSCLQSFPASGSFPLSQFFASGRQSTGASGSALVLPMNIQGWFSFRMDWFDLLAVQGTLKSLLQHHSSNASILQCSAFFMVKSHIHTWPLEKPQLWLDGPYDNIIQIDWDHTRD